MDEQREFHAWSSLCDTLHAPCDMRAEVDAVVAHAGIHRPDAPASGAGRGRSRPRCLRRDSSTKAPFSGGLSVVGQRKAMCWVPVTAVFVDGIDRPGLGLDPQFRPISAGQRGLHRRGPTRAIGTVSPPRPSSTSRTWPSASRMAEITTSGPAGSSRGGGGGGGVGAAIIAKPGVRPRPGTRRCGRSGWCGRPPGWPAPGAVEPGRDICDHRRPHRAAPPVDAGKAVVGRAGEGGRDVLLPFGQDVDGKARTRRQRPQGWPRNWRSTPATAAGPSRPRKTNWR
jgi:hypothetical protein